MPHTFIRRVHTWYTCHINASYVEYMSDKRLIRMPYIRRINASSVCHIRLHTYAVNTSYKRFIRMSNNASYVCRKHVGQTSERERERERDVRGTCSSSNSLSLACIYVHINTYEHMRWHKSRYTACQLCSPYLRVRGSCTITRVQHAYYRMCSLSVECVLLLYNYQGTAC